MRGTRAAPDPQVALEHPGRVLERLALEQAGEEQVALLEAQQLLVELAHVGAREQAAGLELDERRGDEQELGGDVEVEAVEALDLDQERVDDLGQGDLPELHLFLEDQVQQEVERPLVDRGAHLVRHRATRLQEPNSTVCGPGRPD